MGNAAAAGAHADALVLIDEVQGHMGLDGLVGMNAKEVHVQHLFADRMQLQVAHQGPLLGAVHPHIDDLRKESFLLHGLGEFVDAQGDGLGRVLAAVDDARQLVARPPQAAGWRRCRVRRAGWR